jgi:hypothetical protein
MPPMASPAEASAAFLINSLLVVMINILIVVFQFTDPDTEMILIQRSKDKKQSE